MKKKSISIILAAGVLVLPVFFTGCGLFGVSGTMKTLQGHWVDVNGSTTLDFKGNRMTVTSPWHKETFKVRVTGGDVKFIENAGAKENYDRGFYDMSTIQIGRDGALTAQEMVLDAEGHEYRFVREKDLQKELEIQVKDRDLPKTIESDEIVSFSFSFSTEDTSYDIPADSPWYSGRYTFELEKTDDGGYEMSLQGSGMSYIIMDYTGTVSEEYVQNLAALVKEQKLAEYNGWWRTNSEQFHSWTVNIEYASKEKILMEASGRAALECPFSVYAFLEYADREAGYAEEYYQQIRGEEAENEEILQSLQGRWKDLNGDAVMDIDGSSLILTLYEGASPEAYEVRVVGEEIKRIVNVTEGREDSFMIMSELTIMEDGSLSAAEMVLDADGHSFRFVREEDLEKELQYEDLSEDLPKTIESDEITEFYLNFSLGASRYDLPEDSVWQNGSYSVQLEKDEDEYRLDFNVMGESYVICQYSDTVSEAFVQGLAKLIQEEKAAEKNGYHVENKEDFDGWWLSAEYESGEELRLQASGRPALECPFSIRSFLEYFNQEVGFTAD